MSLITEQPITAFLFGKQRQVGPIKINVILNEETSDELEITHQPVQQGAPISDHAFKKPVQFSMRASWSANALSSVLKLGINAVTNPDGNLTRIYNQLLDLQNSRIPFDVFTPKRTYKNVLMASLGQTTDKFTENILMVYMKFEQIIYVPVTTVSVNSAVMKNPAASAGTQPAGTKQVKEDSSIAADTLGAKFQNGKPIQ